MVQSSMSKPRLHTDRSIKTEFPIEVERPLRIAILSDFDSCRKSYFLKRMRSTYKLEPNKIKVVCAYSNYVELYG